jgi:6-phosphogluconolactonase
MERSKEDLRAPICGVVSRRSLLTTAAVFAAAAHKPVRADDDGHKGPILAYMGTYTGAVGNGGNGQGIYLFSLDLGTGKLTQIKVAAAVPSPSWLALHPNGNYLYTVNEISNFNGGSTGSVTSFSINRTTGDLTLLNVVSSQGAGPAHMSVDPLGQFVFVANYGSGSIAVLPILSNGSLANATFVNVDVGSVGPLVAVDAPPGSFAISGHDAPHAHMIQTDPAGKFVFQTDLGQDRIYSWILNRGTGQLTPNSPAFVSVPPGDGPRHFVFHPNGKWFYSIQEEASTIQFFLYDPSAGTLTEKQLISALPQGFTGTNFTSEIRVSQDGKWIYGANRLHDTIAVFAVNRDGSLEPAGETSTEGDYPRSFTIDPTSSYAFSCNQRSDSVTAFRLSADGGRLDFIGEYTPLGSPASIVFLT